MTPDRLFAELVRLYRDVDVQLAESGWTCRACGRCCRFGEYGHSLFCSELESDYLLAEGEIPAGVSDETCPFLEDNRCTRRQRRTLSCRTFFCEHVETGQVASLTESYLRRLKALHVRWKRPWRYASVSEQIRSRKSRPHKG